MEHLFDEFSKSLAASVPRRESLRRIGAVFAGAVLSPLGLGTAWAAASDPCKSFCRCSNKTKQNQCLTACRACNGNTSRLAGACGNYVCCSTASCRGVCSDLRSNPNCGACGNDCRAFGETCCGSYCADLDNDFDNCGGCGARCAFPGEFEDGACVAGHCSYSCVPGAIDCNGTCTLVNSDPGNCGACGNVCPASAPFCDQGVCTANDCPAGQMNCFGACIDILWDGNNCGGCGFQCQPLEHCSWGVCEGSCIGCE
jgi:Stigma-specific protein, Stig1